MSYARLIQILRHADERRAAEDAEDNSFVNCDDIVLDALHKRISAQEATERIRARRQLAATIDAQGQREGLALERAFRSCVRPRPERRHN